MNKYISREMVRIASGKRSKNIVTIALVTACCLLGDSMLYIALPIYWREAGLDGLWQVGVLLAVNRFVRLPLNPVVGKIYGKISLKAGLMFAVFLSIITTVGYGFAGSFAAWLVLRALWGLAWSFLRIGGLSTVSIYGGDNKQGEAMGVYNGLYRLGSLGGMLGGGLLTPFFGLSWVSIIFGLFSAFGIILLAAVYKTEKLKKDPLKKKEKRMSPVSLIQKHALIMGSSFGITMIIQGVFAATLSTLIVYHYGDAVDFWSVAVASAALSGILQALRWAWEPFLAKQVGIWSDGKKGRIPYLIGSLFIGAVSFPLLIVSFSPLIWVGVTILAMLVSTALTTLVDARASDEAQGQDRVRFFTYYTVIQDLGAAAGPFLGYILISFAFGYEMLYILCGGFLFIMMFLWMRKKSSVH
ncbi:MFS transporter [Corticicoccus populi]|uniref:MFS transporter n=1 Tax=Corticicoccus populi TaxID=1812821 RepID=A0ABW5WX23_9STAP